MGGMIMDHSYVYHFIFLNILKLLCVKFKEIDEIFKCLPNYTPGGGGVMWFYITLPQYMI